MTSKHERSALLNKLIEAQRKQSSEARNNFPEENNFVGRATRMCIFLQKKIYLFLWINNSFLYFDAFSLMISAYVNLNWRYRKPVTS